MNYFEKVRDNFIPIQKLYNKFFYSEKVASLLLRMPLSQVNQETAIVFFLSKAYSKHKLLKLYKRQFQLELKINKALDKFKVYDPMARQYVQPIRVKYGQGIEYLILGEILEQDFGFKFDFTPEEIMADGGQELCGYIEQVINRMGDYFREPRKQTLNSIKELINKQRIAKKLSENE